MRNNGIWIANDDIDDQELIREILDALNVPNEVVFFSNGNDLLSKLEQEIEAPFIIMSEVNLPGMDGFMLRNRLLEYPDNKFHSVPFIFWTGTASEAQIEKAYKLRAHGFFIKEPSFIAWKAAFENIITYWRTSKMPSKESAPDESLA